MAAGELRRPQVLVVEDDVALGQLYAEEFGEAGYDVRVVATGEAALEAVERFAPDVVTVDIRLPGMDGIALLRAIKARRPRLPIVVNTAYEQYKDDFGAWACDAYVVKSADTGRLLGAVRRAIASRPAKGAA